MKKQFLTLILLLITLICYSQNEDLLPGGRHCHEVVNDSISKNKFYIPSDINECIKELDKILGIQPKHLLAGAMDVELKRIWGMYIFSEWTENDSTRLCCYFRTKGIDSYEDRDYLILLAYKRHLLKQTFDIDRECSRIIQYHDSIAEEHRQRYEKDIQADSIDGMYIPKNLDDCLPSLDKLLDDTVKYRIKNAESTADVHFGLGRWLRNNWGLWGGSRLQQWFNNQGIQHPDDMSGIILSTYQEYLQKGTVDIFRILEEVKKEYEEFEKRMIENSIESQPPDFEEKDYYSNEYKEFLKKRHIDGIFISR